MDDTEGRTESEVDKLLKELDEYVAARRLRLANPYVLDLIAILYPHKNGLPRRQVINTMWRRRGQKGVNMPKAFDETIQAAFQTYAGDYAAFQARRAKLEDDLFFAPRGKGSGRWAVRQARADAWLSARKLESQ